MRPQRSRGRASRKSRFRRNNRQAQPHREKGEKGYAAWEEKLYAYAEEALAIWEEYEKLTEVEIPSSVTSIGEEVFVECRSLTEVTIPDSVENIDSWAFGMCSGLTKVSFQRKEPPTSEGDVFESCSGLTNIYIPSCQYLEGYRVIVGSDYQDKITASEHEEFTYTAAGHLKR